MTNRTKRWLGALGIAAVIGAMWLLGALVENVTLARTIWFMAGMLSFAVTLIPSLMALAGVFDKRDDLP